MIFPQFHASSPGGAYLMKKDPWLAFVRLGYRKEGRCLAAHIPVPLSRPDNAFLANGFPHKVFLLRYISTLCH